MTSKVASMRDAVAELVHDGDTVAIEGFTHLICFAAGHEIIRQHRRDLTLCRMTPDVIYDQMIGAGVARKLVFSWLGNPGVGSLHAIRRRIDHVVRDVVPHVVRPPGLFARQSREYRANWLQYAWDWVRATDVNGYLQMPGSRTMRSPLDGKRWSILAAHTSEAAAVH